MGEKYSAENFDVNELKEQMSKIKNAGLKANKEYEEKKKKGEVEKQPFSQKIVGIIIIVIIIIGLLFGFISNLDTLLLPKNSITINVTDQDGKIIEGVKINVQNVEGDYLEEFVIESSLTILDAKPGNYILTFEETPSGYSCPDLVDNFTLNQDGKIKLEYECVKEK